MSYYSIDVESDGPVQGVHSMVSFGAVVIEPSLSQTFYKTLKPISDIWIPEALAVSGFTREECMKFEDPMHVMYEFKEWIEKTNKGGRPIFMSDNPGYDFGWINWYFHKYTPSNPFGWSSRRIGDIYCGMEKKAFAKWKWMRKTAHTHLAIDDAMGNAEAVLKIRELGFDIKLI